MGDTRNLVTVICPNHYETLTSGLLNFLATKHRTDYSVQLRSGTVHAHHLILDLFLSPETLDRDFLFDNRDIVEALIQFIYTGRVTVETDKLEHLRSIGLKLDFKLLVDTVTNAQVAGSKDVDVKASGSGSTADQAQPSPSLATTSQRSRKRRKGNPVKIPHPASMVVAELGVDDDTSWSSPATWLARDGVGFEKADSQTDEYKGLDLSVDHQDDEWPDAPSSSSNESTQPYEDTSPEVSEKNYGAETVDPSSVNPSSATPVRRGRGRPASSTGKSSGERIRLYNLSHPEIRCEYQPCKFRCRSDNTYQVHLATQHGSGREVFPCPTCARPYIDYELMERHQDFKHRRPKGEAAVYCELHQCPHCDYKTKDRVLYMVHLNRRHGEGEIFRCDWCSKPFLKSDALERHRQRHKPYKCDHCSFETTKSAVYRYHLFSEHRVNEKGQSVEKIPCPHCDYSTNNKCVLQKHIDTQHTAIVDKPYKCSYAPECTFASARKGDRDKHVRVAHLRLKNHMCELCSFRTSNAYALKKHIGTHSLDKPYECSYCKKKFAGEDSLRKHSKLHTSNDKNHVCPVCMYACNRRDNLLAHMRGVHKITEFDKSPV